MKKYLSVCVLLMSIAYAEDLGGLRGTVLDADFESPLSGASVLIVETDTTAETTEDGTYLITEVPAGKYTLVFFHEGYTREVKAEVVISAGAMTEIDVSLSGEFEEMEEFIVQDVQLGGGTEIALLNLRMESPSLMDSISSELMSKAGVSDAASALKLVAGTTIQDGKYAVVRGLPDRYVNSQMNGVRLPSADADKRAVQLDQFPSAVIESVQVSKTFTPDQQGDASGGAVNVVLKGIPQDTSLNLKVGTGFDSGSLDADWKSYGGGVNFLADAERASPTDIRAAASSDSSAYSSPYLSLSDDDVPFDYDFSLSGGNRMEMDGFTLGVFGSFSHKNSSSYFDDGISDKWFMYTRDVSSGFFSDKSGTFVPSGGGYLGDFSGEDIETSLFDTTQYSVSSQWSGMGIIGIEAENHKLGLAYLRTQLATDTITIGENTRGKEFYFPGYDPTDKYDTGNLEDNKYVSPYIYNQTLTYQERITETIQLNGEHILEDFLLDGLQAGNAFTFLAPEIDWTVSQNLSELNEPDKTQFSAIWIAPGVVTETTGGDAYLPSDWWMYPGVNPNDPTTWPTTNGQTVETDTASYYIPNTGTDGMGNYQRIWKEIIEESEQGAINFKLPFEQWTDTRGYLKFGLFKDHVERTYRQESLANSETIGDGWGSDWGDIDFADYFSNYDNLPVDPATDPDVDYDGEQDIFAWYYMADLPITSNFKLIGGFRHESTDITTTNFPHSDLSTVVNITGSRADYTGEVTMMKYSSDAADADYSQDDILPALSYEYKPFDTVTLRGSYTETTARQTFKELSPIVQQEYLGGPLFAGNPDLEMSALKNYDLRLDWTPYERSLVSISYFKKDVKSPIEYVQMINTTNKNVITVPVNYDEGELSGFELEFRQQLGDFSPSLEGIGIGANATFIDSEVSIPHDGLYDALNSSGYSSDTRPMTNTPEALYNFFVTWDLEETDTSLGLFYTIRGDTLVAGAGQNLPSGYIPDVYETEYGTLNFTMSQKLDSGWNLMFSAKNLLDPEIQSVYRADGNEMVKSSYSKGMSFSVSMSKKF
ncbi:MAG: TonB-dependent receptor [Phycisphaerae bacterium]